MRTIEELRELANDMNKSLEVLLYEMLNNAINENKRYKKVINIALELLQLLHYKIDDFDSMHNDIDDFDSMYNDIEDIQKVLKWVE